jgi:hypothetical protein
MARSGLVAMCLVALLAPGCGAGDGQLAGSPDADGQQFAEVAGEASLNTEQLPESTPQDETAPEVKGPSEVDSPACSVTGRVLDDDGAPVANLPLVLCDTQCKKGETAEDGSFSFPAAHENAQALEVKGGTLGLTSVTVPVPACGEGERHLGDLPVVGLAVGEQCVAADGGVIQACPELKLHLTGPVWFPNYEESIAVHGARLTQEQIPPAILAQVTPLAAFALDPYGTTASGPISAEITLAELATLTQVQVYVLDHFKGTVLPAYVAPVVEGRVVTPEGQGLPELSWIILSEVAAE